MPLKTERTRILDMVELGTISPDEAATLLAVLNRAEGVSDSAENSPPLTTTLQPENSHPLAPHWLRIRVFNDGTDQSHINVNVPIGLLDVSQRMGARFVPWLSEDDYKQLIHNLQDARSGQIFEFSDKESQEKIELWVE